MDMVQGNALLYAYTAGAGAGAGAMNSGQLSMRLDNGGRPSN
jgi:hypothetical protein